ncbi:hypothetical protein D9613_001119 [Agrocybe pediades]|uniref:Uncharacterized protein n=1 Tax=Agrocybe pediades TaxID=84607 RepID=A0A8H4R2N2_9AGAR|nr:hypothetical protein D9613_001119 [Agrocybe pediades]
MGKNNKGPPYKLPSCKYLVIERPWVQDTDNIAAWMEVMLRQRYPDAQAEIVYHQKQAAHGCVIVKLPEEVTDIKPYLGEHLYGRFLSHKIGRSTTERSFIYEYDFRNQGKPEVKWIVEYPSNKDIDREFPVVDPYPLPVWPTVTMENRPFFALKLAPPELPKPAVPPQLAPQAPAPDASSSHGSTSQIHNIKEDVKEEKPTHLGHPHVDTKEGLRVPNEQMSRVKIYPYEQGNCSQYFIMKTTLCSKSSYIVEESKAFLKTEDNYVPKAELQDLYSELFTSESPSQDNTRGESEAFRSSVKTEDASGRFGSSLMSVEEEDRKPVIPKEELDTHPTSHIVGAEDYVPKAELQDLYTQLFAPDLQVEDSQREEGLDGSHRPVEGRVKNEPAEFAGVSEQQAYPGNTNPSEEKYIPKPELIHAVLSSGFLKSEPVEPEHARDMHGPAHSFDIRVKEEQGALQSNHDSQSQSKHYANSAEDNYVPKQELIESLLYSGYLESDSVKREQEQETQSSAHPGVGMKDEPEDGFQSNLASQTGYSGEFLYRSKAHIIETDCVSPAVGSATKRGPEHIRERDSVSARKRLKTEDMW